MATKKKELVPAWQQQLSQHIKKAPAPREKPLTGDYISTKGAKFSLGGATMGREFEAVVVDWCFENSFYDKAFKEGEANTPKCFAITKIEDELSPHENSPVPQHNECEGCDMNEWGSSLTGGKGKACTNRRRLALVVEAKNGNAEIKLLRIAPTTINNWKKFVGEVENMDLHLMQCMVRIRFDDDSTAASPPIIFELIEEITSEKTLTALAGALEPAGKLLAVPYDVTSFEVEKPSKKKKVVRKKKSKFS